MCIKITSKIDKLYAQYSNRYCLLPAPYIYTPLSFLTLVRTVCGQPKMTCLFLAPLCLGNNVTQLWPVRFKEQFTNCYGSLLFS